MGDGSLNFDIAVFLIQDGVTSGAIYALLALALVLVFAVTRVIFIPQGEYLAFGALTLASLQAGKTPGILWLLMGAGMLAAAMDVATAWQNGKAKRVSASLLWNVAYPTLMAGLLAVTSADELPMALQVVLTLALVVPLGPMIYRIAYQPLADASVLVLLIVSVAVHLALTGLGLVFFGAEGSRTPPFTAGNFTLAGFSASAQSVWVVASSLMLIVVLYFFFERSMYGKALRATAVNRVGARLMGIPAIMAGKLTFGLAALIGTFSGILIAPLTTIYYDSGFLIGLKGFVGAIVAGLASYPLAAAGALLVGMLESVSSFWASAFKEVIVFTLIIPVLLWRSLSTHHVEEDE